jgi:anti-anti-sigma regulatory factor
MSLSPPDALSIQNVAALRQRWLAELDALPADAPEVGVDLGMVPDVDAAGLQLLVSLARTVERRGGRLRLTGAREGLRSSLAELRSGLCAQMEG